MKTTGIVRRIDELGRVVIPKELRRTMHIKEGEEMEVFVAPDDTLILKKYSALKALGDFSKEYADILFRHTGNNCVVMDNDRVLSAATEKNLYLDKRISKACETFLSKRKSAYLRGTDVFGLVDESGIYKEMSVAPLIFNGDVLGGIALLGKSGMTDESLKLVEIAASFLAKQFE